jgi:hypothetical protein
MKLTSEMIRRFIREELEVILAQNEEEFNAEIEEKKERKPHCKKGNAYHDENGRWTDRSSAKSFSLKFETPPGSKDCVGGQARMPGQRFAKLPAGRKNKDGSDGKEKWKLKDGTAAWE